MSSEASYLFLEERLWYETMRGLNWGDAMSS
jgi:hypothetical protein